MIEILTRNALYRAGARAVARAGAAFARLRERQDRAGLVLQAIMGAFLGGLGLLFVSTLLAYREAASGLTGPESSPALELLPGIVPIVSQGVGLLLAAGAFGVSLLVREGNSPDRRRLFVVLSLMIASFAALAAWLPTDVIETRAAILGKAPAGETPSIPAYLGMLLLVSLLILSVPVAAMAYFRLGLMDRYVVDNFLTPLAMCLFSFMAIWVLADFTDNGETLAGLSFGSILSFYVMQVPFVILFVMPIAVLLSGLFSLSKMSKANEFISMIGSGRSVPRILAPLFVAGAYVSLIGLAFKYEWAPASVGYKEATIQTAKREQWAKRQGGARTAREDLWSKRGWMHVNEVDRRSWFVGRVPLKLSDEMGDIVVTLLDERDQPLKMWIAKRAKWIWDSKPPKWIFTQVRVYTYDANHIPTIESHARLEFENWPETPWKVLSSSQNPEYLGVPGLTMYLNANRDLDDRSLASFRTNWWYVFAEPLACLSMILVAAPLGIVYSRRGVMGGVTGAICIFAMMYVMRGTFLAMGHSGYMPPFLAAWVTNVVVAAIGLVLLWFRARNREIPKLKSLFQRRTPRPAS